MRGGCRLLLIPGDSGERDCVGLLWVVRGEWVILRDDSWLAVCVCVKRQLFEGVGLTVCGETNILWGLILCGGN